MADFDATDKVNVVYLCCHLLESDAKPEQQ